MKHLFSLGIVLCLCVVPAAAQEEEEIVPVVVALQDLSRGLLLTEELVLGESPVVGLAFYPSASLPATAIQNLDELIGYRLRTDVPMENPLVRHYFFPDPILQPAAEAPFPIAPNGLRVVRDYTAYREVTFNELDRVLYPARLAAGDSVAIVITTTLGSPLQDETSFLLRSVVIAQLTEEAITFSVTETQQETLEAYLESGLPLTLVMRSPADADAELESFNNGTNLMNWGYLLNRDDDPLIIPDGADLTSVGSE